MNEPGRRLADVLKILTYSGHRTVEGDRYSLRNPWALLARTGSLEFSDGSRLPFNAGNRSSVERVVMFALENGVRFGKSPGSWRIDPAGQVIETPSGLRFVFESVDPTIFAETFLQDVHYTDFDLQGRTVVTGGAFVGDTALYHAQKGATVFALEPDPRSFGLAQRNLALNPDAAKSITLRNWAIGHDGWVAFPLIPEGSGGSSLGSLARDHVRVRSVSLQTILSEFSITAPYLLDLDIKGQEFCLLEDDALGRFERLRIEYSPFLRSKDDSCERSLARLLERLGQLGYHDVRVFKHNALRYDLQSHGTIDARRSRGAP